MRCKKYPCLRVSILVLLEIALEVSTATKEPVNADSRFNPCSIGNCSGRYVGRALSLTATSFQSLFYWKLLWKKKRRAVGFFELTDVSILVLLEIALEA